VIGLSSFVLILHSYGFPRLGTDILSLGWWAIPLALSFGPVVLCYSIAWLLVTPEVSPRQLPTLFRFASISVAWNNLSPFVKVLGEPIRMAMLERWMSRKDAARSMVLYNLVHSLGTLLGFFFGATAILFFFPLPEGFQAGLLSVLIVIPVLATGLFLLPQRWKRLGRSARRNRIVLAGFWLRWAFSKIRIFSRRHPTRFWGAVFVEILARFVEGLTFYFAFLALGQPLSLLYCSLLDVGRALMDNIFFFIPYQVGSREGGIVLLAEHVLRIDSRDTVSAAVFYRLVEISWMAIGYLLWIAENKSRKLPT